MGAEKDSDHLVPMAQLADSNLIAQRNHCPHPDAPF